MTEDCAGTEFCKTDAFPEGLDDTNARFEDWAAGIGPAQPVQIVIVVVIVTTEGLIVVRRLMSGPDMMVLVTGQFDIVKYIISVVMTLRIAGDSPG